MRFYDELIPRPTPRAGRLPLVGDCLFNIFAATLRIGGRSSIRTLRTRHSVVTGSHLWRNVLGLVLKWRTVTGVKDWPALRANWIFCWLNRRSVAYCQLCTWTAPRCEKLAAVRKDESFRRQRLWMQLTFILLQLLDFVTVLRMVGSGLICTAEQRSKQLRNFRLCRTGMKWQL